MLDFLILYEHKVRELDNICLLRAELERRGYSVEFHQIDALKRLKFFTTKKPKVILGTALGNDIRINNYIFSTVGNINKIVNLQLEQVISKKWENTSFFKPSGEALDITYICWGKESYERLIKNGVKNAVICGAIQMDFLRKEADKYFLSKEELYKKFGLDINKKVVLYISSFSMTTITEEVREHYESVGGIRVDDIIDVFKKSKVQTLLWIEEFLKTYPDVDFIYRLHPNEREDNSIRLLSEKYLNFKIISDLSVKQWLKIVDKVYTWISTASAEAYFADVKFDIVRPFKIPEYIDIPLYKNSQQITNKDDFLNSLNEERKNMPLNEEEIFKRYDYDEKIPAFKKICDLLEEVYNTKKYDCDLRKKRVFKNYLRAFVHEIIYRYNLLDEKNIKKIPLNSIKKYLTVLSQNGVTYKSKEELSQEEIDEIMFNANVMINQYK